MDENKYQTLKRKYAEKTEQLSLMETKLQKTQERLETVESAHTAYLIKKIERQKQKIQNKAKQEERAKTMIDMITLCLKQAHIEARNRNTPTHTFLRVKLEKLADTLENMFGGMAFVAPLAIAENNVLATTGDCFSSSGRAYMEFTWSSSAKTELSKMGKSIDHHIHIENSPLFEHVVNSRKVYYPNLKITTLPVNHVQITSAVVIPVVVEYQTLALIGLANGNYPEEDIKVLEDVTPIIWKGIVSEGLREAARRAMIIANTLPATIAEQLISSDQFPPTIAQYHECVAISFTDIVGFTTLAAKLPVDEVLSYLNAFFSVLDEAADRFNVEKIKTIGDCYMAVSGCPTFKNGFLESMLDFLLYVLKELQTNLHGHPTAVRMGVHCGPVIAGVIGKTRVSYDVWGDTVNIASRLEANGITNAIILSEEVYTKIKDNHKYNIKVNGLLELKGIGTINSYVLNITSGINS